MTEAVAPSPFLASAPFAAVLLVAAVLPFAGSIVRFLRRPA